MAKGGGELEVALRYDGMWLGRGEDLNAEGGSQGGTLAFKWWPKHFLSASVASYLTHYDAAAIERPDELWSWGLLGRVGFYWTRDSLEY